MKTRPCKFVGRSAGFASALLTTTLLVPLLATGADTSFTATGYLVQVPAPGILVTNSLGQVMLKGNVHVVAMQSSDPRATGRMQAGMDLGYQADGTATFGGQAYFEVGTWQNQTNFTPATGLWVMNYRGVAQADNSDTITTTGYGVGGTIDGWRVESTATRAAGPSGDPTIPYLVSGVIKSPPVTVTNAIDETQAPSWSGNGLPPQGALFTTNNQLTIRAAWPGSSTVYPWDTSAWVGPMTPWAVAPGHTFQARVDVARVNLPSVHCFMSLYHDSGQGYWFARGTNWFAMGKQNVNGVCFFSAAPAPTRKNNEILALSLTPSGNNVLVTVRVLDRDNADAVVCETSALDTPAADPTLTAEQVTSITGLDLLSIVPDLAEVPWTSGISPTVIMQQHTDGTLPAAEATFDHLELRTYDIPPLGVGRAVQLSWPSAAGTSYSVESAPSPLGPWLPLNLQVPPGMQQLTAPATKSAEFFRLQSAP